MTDAEYKAYLTRAPGRETALKALTRFVKLGRSAFVVGGPALGKTTLARAFEHRLLERWARQPNETKIVPVYIDAASFEDSDKKWVLGLWTGIYQALLDPKVSGGFDFSKYREFKPKADRLWEELYERLTEVFTALSGTRAWVQYVLILDNLDAVAEIDAEDVQQGLASLVEGKQPWHPHCIIGFGGRATAEMRSDRYNPLRVVQNIELGLLPEYAVSGWIEEFAPEMPYSMKHGLAGLTGGHPHLVALLVDGWRAEGEDVELETLTDTLDETFEALFERQWQAFDMDRGVAYRGAYAAPEHALMQLSIDIETSISIRQAEKQLALKGLREYAHFLGYNGVVSHRVSQDATAIEAVCGLWNRWYRFRIRQ